jgi:MFS family permease
VLSNHGDAAQLGVVLACYGIPRAALTTVGGVLADRISPRTIMLVSDAVRCVLTAVFAVFAADHTSSLAALAPVAAVLGASSALFIPASYTIMPSLLDGERLSSANATYQGVFLIAAVALALVPFLGGLPGAAAAMLVFGVALGFDGVLSITLLQEWAPEGMLGRVMGVILLAGTVSFPVSTAVAGLLARHFGPSAVFPIAGALLAAAMLGGLSQREFRSFGVGQEEAVPERVLGGARLAQVGLPLRVAVVLGADQAPVGAPRNVGDHRERPAQFG